MDLNNLGNAKKRLSPAELWSLDKETFNEWRKENDLPQLLAFFKENLPDFKSWMQESSISDEMLIGYEAPSEFLRGSKDKYYCIVEGPPDGPPSEQIGIMIDRPPKQYVAEQNKYFGRATIAISSSQKFTPYFHWRKMKRKFYFRLIGSPLSQVFENITYNQWMRTESFQDSTARMFGKFNVLKLGGICIGHNKLDGRNLDFVDLDGLQLVGHDKYNGTYTKICYSSCRSISVKDAEKSFVVISSCRIENLSIENSKLQDWHFEDVLIDGIRVKASRLFRCSFNNSYPNGFELDDSKVLEIDFSNPPEVIGRAAIAEYYKIVRICNQQQGNRHLVRHFYYKERFQEMLGGAWPIITQMDRLRLGVYSGTYLDIFRKWQVGHYTKKIALKCLVDDLRLSYLLPLNPKIVWNIVSRKIKAAFDILDYAIWGFGERPSRICILIFVIISGFAVNNYLSGETKDKLPESIACSAFNYATIGCNTKRPIDAIEGVFGAASIGLMIAGFANRSRY